MRSVLDMDVPSTSDIVQTAKVGTALEHLRQNRIEYLLLLIVSHFLGITDVVLSRINGVCF